MVKCLIRLWPYVSARINNGYQRNYCATLNSFKVETATTIDSRFHPIRQHLLQEFTNLAQNRTYDDSFDRLRFAQLQRFSEFERLLSTKHHDMRELQQLRTETSDPDIHSEIDVDLAKYARECKAIENEILTCIVPEEVWDTSDVYLEISSGAGGQEAMLFAKDLMSLYRKYAATHNWGFELMESSDDTAAGGFRKAIALIVGQDVYKHFKFEGGIHRVQRVPATATDGRMHTSTVSVAVLLKPKTEINIEIKPGDLKTEVMCSSGPGGQHVNKTESRVRLTHLPTGLIADSQEERSQIMNRRIAMERLRTMLHQREHEKRVTQTQAQRKLQIGTKERSERIRTYNFPQNRITDHRIKFSVHNILSAMNGGEEFDQLIQALLKFNYLERLEEFCTQFERTHRKS